MSSAKNPVFVLIPGSFSPPTSYEKVVLLLEQAGYEAHAVPLVSANSEGTRKEPATMQDDAASIKTALSGLIDSGKEIVIGMHSYAGFPGTEATKGLAKSDRLKERKEGGVVGLVYIAAWMPPVGKSIFALQNEPDLIKNAGEYTYIPDGMYKFIFPDFPEEEALKYAADLKNHSSACWHEGITYPGYKFIPTTCVIPDNDLVIATSIQKEQAAREEKEGVKITVYELEGGHVPILSLPEKVAEILISVAKAG